MKFIQKSIFALSLCAIMVLSSCHQKGCPGQITDTFEQKTTAPAAVVCNDNI